MSVLEFLGVFVFFVLELVIGYALPIVCTFRANPANERWLIHWIVFILLQCTLFRYLEWQFSPVTYWFLKVVFEAALLFVVGIKSQLIRDSILKASDIVKHTAQEKLELVKKQLNSAGIQLQ